MHPILTNSKNILIQQTKEMLPFMLIAIPLLIIIRILIYRSNKKKNIPLNLWHETGFILFGMFMAGLLSSTIMPNFSFTENGFTTDVFQDMWHTSFMPGTVIFRSISAGKNFDYHYFTFNLLGNIAVFVPFGFFVPLLWKKMNFGKTVLSGALLSVSIEFIQLFMPRFTDIDDVILNTLGTLIGALIYMAVNKLFPGFTQKFKNA